MLLLTGKEELVRRFTSIFSDVGVTTNVIPESLAAIAEMSTRHYAALLVDCSEPRAWDVLDLVRQTGMCQKSIVFALVSDTTDARKANLCGANFLIVQPISWDLIRRMARAAQSMILRERRASDRERVRTTAFVSLNPREESPVMILDLSDGGLALLSRERMRVGDQAFVRFELPGSDMRIESQCRVMWSKEDGQAGLKFIQLPDRARSDIKKWFAKHRPRRITPRGIAAGTN